MVCVMRGLDGKIYQTLDLKERAWHATIANDRSVGIEIANMGAYAADEPDPLDKWYSRDTTGQTRITVPEQLGDGGIRTKGFVGRPVRPAPVKGVIQGKEVTQYDFTPQQYQALIRLTASLCKIFPKISCDYPHDGAGKVIPKKLPADELKGYEGVLGDYLIQTDKVDPGPAFQWDFFMDHARGVLNGASSPPRPQNHSCHPQHRLLN